MLTRAKATKSNGASGTYVPYEWRVDVRDDWRPVGRIEHVGYEKYLAYFGETLLGATETREDAVEVIASYARVAAQQRGAST